MMSGERRPPAWNLKPSSVPAGASVLERAGAQIAADVLADPNPQAQ